MEPSFQQTPSNPVVIPHAHRSWMSGVALLLVAALSITAGSLLFANYWPQWDDSAPVFASPSPSGDSKVYKNPTYQFTVSYQQSWHSEECSDTSPEGTSVLVGFGDAKRLIICNSDAPLQAVFTVGAGPGSINQQQVAATLAALDGARRTSIVVDGQAATRVEGSTRQLDGHSAPSGLKQVIIWAERGGALYTFIFIGQERDLSHFEATLATFKFGSCEYRQVQCITTPCYPQLMCTN